MSRAREIADLASGGTAGQVIQVKQTFDREVRSFTARNNGNWENDNHGFDTAGADLTSLDLAITVSKP